MIDFFVAVALFMIVLGAFFQLTAIKVRATGEAERRLRAIWCAQSKLAEVRCGAVGGVLESVTGGTSTYPIEGALGGEGELTVKPRTDGLRDVSVTVRWREPNKGGTQEVQLKTVLQVP